MANDDNHRIYNKILIERPFRNINSVPICNEQEGDRVMSSNKICSGDKDRNYHSDWLCYTFWRSMTGFQTPNYVEGTGYCKGNGHWNGKYRK